MSGQGVSCHMRQLRRDIRAEPLCLSMLAGSGIARALLSEADISVKPVVAGMRLGGRSPDARTGCGMHIRYGVEGVGGRGRTAFSVLGTMIDLIQCLYHSDIALSRKVYRWAAGPLRVVVVVVVADLKMAVARCSGWLAAFPSINKHLLPLS
jgi:hypothetical protein